jgi:tetratricopeptide (TPR) repeat protein
MIRRLVGSIVAVMMLCGASGFAQEERISPLSDFLYKRDYQRFEEIQKEADSRQKADLLFALIKERAISRILLHAVTDYLETAIRPVIEKQDWANATSRLESLMALMPSEKQVHAEEIPVGVEDYLNQQLAPARASILRAFLAVHLGAQNLPKAAETAERLHALSPDISGIQLLADIYLQMQNYDKYMVYGKQIIDKTPISQPLGYGTALQMAQVYLQQQNVNAATDLYEKVMNVYGDKVPPNVPEAQWNQLRAVAFGLMAARVYQKKDYAKAQQLYGRVLQFDSKRDDAYYFIGMARWQQQNPEGAVEPFAKAVVLKRDYAQRAQQYLEQIYKGLNNDSLDGIDKVLSAARSELGIG